MKDFIVSHEAEVTEAECFTPEYWHKKKAIVGESGGRNRVWFVQAGASQWVLRHYYRGGVPGRILTDQFLFTDFEKTRSVREYHLLHKMFTDGLPVPKPIAAHVQRSGLIYRANLLIERIPQSQDLGRWLLHKELSKSSWMAIGHAIAELHNAGVWHADLNCKNILWQAESGKAWLIDFDRSEYREGTTWRANNMARLLRSFEKEMGLAAKNRKTFYWQRKHWDWLVAAYTSAVTPTR